MDDEPSVERSPTQRQIDALREQVALDRADIDALQARVEANHRRADASEFRADADRRRIDAGEARAEVERQRVDAGEARADADRLRIDALEAHVDVDREMILELQAEGLISSQHVAHLEQALQSSRRIGAAIGIVMATRLVSEAHAFAALRKASQNTNRKLREIADELVLTGSADDLPSA